MDFEAAERRLQRDQSKLKSRQLQRQQQTVRAKEAAARRREADRQRAAALSLRQQQFQHVEQYMNRMEAKLYKNTHPNKLFQATSIWGEGDKIALPPSVLQTLSETDSMSSASGAPLTFRIGLLRPDYVFPASQALKTMMDTAPVDDELMTIEDDEDDDETNDTKNKKTQPQEQSPYLQELAHRYISYTHATVVEFTQEEGHVGLPKPIASALLDPDNQTSDIPRVDIAVTRTMDPAGESSSTKPIDMETDDPVEDDAPSAVTEDEEKTPGHLAWGAFDVPSADIEVTLVQLPRGTECTLNPTQDAVRHGFHQLKDVKLVLEQSLIRTRATLSVGDTVSTWHRGTEFELRVSAVTPSEYRSVICINTDLEVDIGPVLGGDDESAESPQPNERPSSEPSSSPFAPGTGYTLSGSTTLSHDSKTKEVIPMANAGPILLAEPPLEQRKDVCAVQIRGDGAMGKRRFDVTVGTVQDLLAFGATIVPSHDRFRLVTRFPRRVWELSETNCHTTLADAGMAAGQEVFMMEKIE